MDSINDEGTDGTGVISGNLMLAGGSGFLAAPGPGVGRFNSLPDTWVTVPVKVLPGGEGLPLPRYETSGASAFDLYAAVTQPGVLEPLERALIPTGLAIAVPRGYELQIRPRSGLALKHGVTVLNTPGTIDSDYRGEIGVILINQGEETFLIERGMRIAQAVLAKVEHALLTQVDELDETERGAAGFGSTGLAGDPS